MDKCLSGVKNIGRAIYTEINTGEKVVRLKNQLPGAIMPSCPVPSQNMKSRLGDTGMLNLNWMLLDGIPFRLVRQGLVFKHSTQPPRGSRTPEYDELASA